MRNGSPDIFEDQTVDKDSEGHALKEFISRNPAEFSPGYPACLFRFRRNEVRFDFSWKSSSRLEGRVYRKAAKVAKGRGGREDLVGDEAKRGGRGGRRGRARRNVDWACSANLGGSFFCVLRALCVSILAENHLRDWREEFAGKPRRSQRDAEEEGSGGR